MIGLGASVVLGDVVVGCPTMLGGWLRLGVDEELAASHARPTVCAHESVNITWRVGGDLESLWTGCLLA